MSVSDHHKYNSHYSESGVEKQLRVITPYNGTSLNPTGTKITEFRLPQEKGLYLNGKDTVFYMTATTGGTNEALLPFALQSCISQIEIFCNDSSVQVMDNFNIMEVNRLNNITTHGFKEGAGLLYNRYTLTEATNQNLGTARLMLQMPDCVLYQDVLPLDASWRVKITIGNDASVMFTADSDDATLTLGDIEMHCQCIAGDVLDQEYMGRDVVWDFKDYHSSIHDIDNSASSKQLTFGVAHPSLRAVRVFMYSTAVLADSSTYTRYVNKLFNGTTDYAFKLSGKNFPSSRVDATSGTEVLQHMLETYDIGVGDYEKYPGDVGDATTDLAFCYDFRGDKKAISGLFAGNMGNAQMSFDWRGSASAATTAYVQVEFDRAIRRSAGGDWIWKGE